LSDAGFRSIGFYRNGWIAPTFGFQQGFEIYSNPPARPIPPQAKAAKPTLSQVGTDESTVAAAVEFLRVSRNDQKFFLYLHLMDVHEYVYDEESAIFGAGISDKYDSSILWTDGTLNAFFAYLAHWGLFENTIVVIAADHGEAFRERGLEGHARALYRESTTTPWIIALPFRLDPSIVVQTQTENVDIWPTIFEILGIDAPTFADGRSRVPEIVAAAQGMALPDSDTSGFAHLDRHWGQRGKEPRPFVAVTDGSFRYLESPGANAEVDKAEELRARAAELLADEPAWEETPTRDIDEFELNQLRALGYSIP
jgi:arylsulfatase A-like enzyme